MIDHIWRPVSNYEASKEFYGKTLAPLGYKLVRDYSESKRAGFAVIDRDGHRDFWVVESAGDVKGSKFCLAFRASSREQVNEFYKSAIDAGATDNGKPGYRDEYGTEKARYYAAFVLDPDGYNIEAVFDDIEHSLSTDIASRYFDLSNNQDLNGLQGLLTDTTTYSSPNVGVFLGVEQIMEMKRSFYGSFKEMSWDVKDVKEIRDGVVEFDFVFRGTTNDGDVIERPGTEHVIVKDGKLQHIEVRNK